MYVVVLHEITSPEAFDRGTKLMTGEGAPAGVRVLQFLPSRDGSAVTCLWESPSVAAVQGYVDAILGDTSRNTSYEVAASMAFAEHPAGLAPPPAVAAAG